MEWTADFTVRALRVQGFSDAESIRVDLQDGPKDRSVN